jgi:hypothetical protein
LASDRREWVREDRGSVDVAGSEDAAASRQASDASAGVEGVGQRRGGEEWQDERGKRLRERGERGYTARSGEG